MVGGVIIGVDGGGTKTQAWCVDTHFRLLGEGSSGPSNPAAVGHTVSLTHLREAIEEAYAAAHGAPLSALVVGMAGLDTEQEVAAARQLLTQELAFLSPQILWVGNDTHLALRSGTESPNAIVLISGTGSNCYGRTEDGAEAWAGGLDYLLADEGSGYAVGLAVLRASVRAEDGRGSDTLLHQMVLDHFSLSSVRELKSIVYQPDFTKPMTAELAQYAFLARDQGDQLSSQILTQACWELLAHVTAVYQQLEWAGNPPDLVLVGGMMRPDRLFPELSGLVAQAFPQMRVIIPEHPPVFGAIVLAKDLLD